MIDTLFGIPPAQAQDGLGAASHDLSAWGLFLMADPIVKAVMVLLVLASIWTWKLIFEKQLRIRRLRQQAESFEDAFWSGGSLEDLHRSVGDEPENPIAAVFAAGMREFKQSGTKGAKPGGLGGVGLADRIERVMEVQQTRELAELERGMTFLATTGSAAPFIGLFGTVWGIMNAFTAIAAEANTSLAVVAPGMAEALFATALGLVAAIPASAAYNKFTNDTNKYAERLDNFAIEFAAILERHLEERSA